MKDEIKKDDADFIEFKIEKAKKEAETKAKKDLDVKLKEAKIGGLVLGVILGVLLMLFYLFVITRL